MAGGVNAGAATGAASRTLPAEVRERLAGRVAEIEAADLGPIERALQRRNAIAEAWYEAGVSPEEIMRLLPPEISGMTRR